MFNLIKNRNNFKKVKISSKVKKYFFNNNQHDDYDILHAYVVFETIKERELCKAQFSKLY